MGTEAAVADEPLARALLEFAAAPGRYAVRLREPHTLYSQIDTLALWAMGRLPAALQAQADRLQAAAIVFLQRACFAPDNTHYQVLGLLPDAVLPETLRTRYRALIRLTHPDMGIAGLGPNAAGLVNRAHEVLGNPVLRRQYDETLARHAALARPRTAPLQGGAAAAADAAPWPGHPRRHPTEAGVGGRPWHALVARYPAQTRTLLAAGGAALLVGGLVVFAAQESKESGKLLVARKPTPDAARPVPQEKQRAGAGADTTSTASMPPSSAAGAGAPPPPERSAPLALALSSAMPKQATPTASAVPVAPVAPAEREPMPQPANARPAAVAGATTLAVVAAASAVVPPAESVQQVQPVPSVRSMPSATAVAPPPLAAQVQESASLPAPAAALPAAPAMPASHRAVAAPAVAAAATPPLPAEAAPAPPAPLAKPAPAWDVDMPQARHYLADLVTLLERPQDVQRAQNHLVRMNVKGNLLEPALRLQQQYPQVKVDQVALAGGERSVAGAASMAALVSVRAGNGQAAPSHAVSYRLTAHFIGTREGTALAQLDMREVK